MVDLYHSVTRSINKQHCCDFKGQSIIHSNYRFKTGRACVKSDCCIHVTEWKRLTPTIERESVHPDSWWGGGWGRAIPCFPQHQPTNTHQPASVIPRLKQSTLTRGQRIDLIEWESIKSATDRDSRIYARSRTPKIIFGWRWCRTARTGSPSTWAASGLRRGCLSL